jgi:hypothetical protein
VPGPSQRFEIVLVSSARDDPVTLGSETDPDQATVTFHQELQRLKKERIQGELIMVCHENTGNAVLRQSLA